MWNPCILIGGSIVRNQNWKPFSSPGNRSDGAQTQLVCLVRVTNGTPSTSTASSFPTRNKSIFPRITRRNRFPFEPAGIVLDKESILRAGRWPFRCPLNSLRWSRKIRRVCYLGVTRACHCHKRCFRRHDQSYPSTDINGTIHMTHLVDCHHQQWIPFIHPTHSSFSFSFSFSFSLSLSLFLELEY